MIPLEVVAPAIQELIGRLSEIQAVWRDQPQGFVKFEVGAQTTPGAICKLSISPSATKGRDEIRTHFDTAARPLYELQDIAIGIRLFTLKMLFEVFDQNSGKDALFYAERTKTRFRFRSTTRALNAVNCSFVNFLDIQDLSTMRDNRIVSIVSLDVRLSGVAIDWDPEKYPLIGVLGPMTGSLTPA